MIKTTSEIDGRGAKVKEVDATIDKYIQIGWLRRSRQQKYVLGRYYAAQELYLLFVSPTLNFVSCSHPHPENFSGFILFSSTQFFCLYQIIEKE